MALDVIFLLLKYVPAFLQIQAFQGAMPQLIKGFDNMILNVCCFILTNFGRVKSMDGMTSTSAGPGEAHVVVCFCNTGATFFKAGRVTLT